MASSQGLLAAVRVDLEHLLALWRELLFPDQIEADPVYGHWEPETVLEHVAFWGWSALGVPLVAVLYPLAVAGFGARYLVRRLDTAAARLGVLAVVALVALVWGGLTAVAWVRFSPTGFRAVLAASAVATVSAGLARGFAALDGRPVTVVFAYPFAVSTVVLPPVTAALYSPTLAAVVKPGSTSLAVWLLEGALSVGGVAEFLRTQFDLTGPAYVAMWFGLAVPVGWTVGLLVTLANALRPSSAES
jgi:hypothetical protein